MAAALVGAAIGAYLVQHLDAKTLSQAIPWLIGAAAVYIVMSPRLGDVDSHQRISIGVYGATAALLLGCYDGFFGPASGSFFAISFITLLGYHTARATAHAKLLLMVTNASSLLVFVAGGQVVWLAGGCMAVGQWIGARYGAQMVYLKGNRLVKPMLLILCCLLMIKMIWWP